MAKKEQSLLARQTDNKLKEKQKPPSKRKKTSLYLDETLMASLKSVCEKKGYAMSQVLETLIEQYLGKSND